MAEKDEARAYPHKRNTTYSRGHPGQNRLYNQLGVKDLRELLDRKRSERGHVNEPHSPPHDPSYSYLKDPLRENEDNNQMRHNNTRKFHSKNNPSNKRDPQSGGNVTNYPKNRDIENPLNIKVEFSTSTGEHVYKLDETTILPTIKHVPDRLPHQSRPFRGRGRGRGRGQQRTYQTRTIRSNNFDKRTPKNNVSETEHLQPVLSNADENWDDELQENGNQGAENEEFEEAVDNNPPEEAYVEDVHDALEAGVQNLNLDESKTQSENLVEDKCDENKAQIQNKCDEKNPEEKD